MNAFVKWLVSILNKLGLYTKSQMEAKDAAIRSLGVNIESLADKAEKADAVAKSCQIRAESAEGQVGDLKVTIRTLEAVRETLQSDVVKYKEAASENLDLIKGLQSQLGDVFREHPVFGFPSGYPIPGSTCVVTSETRLADDSIHVVCRGRSILTDEMTSKIDGTPSIEDRTNLIIEYMQRYSLFEKIAADIMRWGGMRLSLAYNKNCTAYEVYYEVIAEHAKNGAVVVVDRSKEDVETEAE